MPRDSYLSFIQNALERRIELKRRLAGEELTTADGEPQAADRTTRDLGDRLFSRFGPNDWEWIKTVVEALLTTVQGNKHPFGTTPAEVALAPRARIVLLADWGTGTPGAQGIAELARTHLQEATDRERHLIHLGDVYYCGLPDEYQARFLRYWPATEGDGITSWNLNGNHDMYSGGHGYFDVISKAPFSQQNGTSCFRLFNEHWQFIGLDTAYLDNDLYPVQLPWVEDWVLGGGPSPDGSAPPKTVLLSHHQLGSALAQGSVGPGIRNKTKALRSSRRVHAWFWGHEHRAFLYKPYENVACPVCLGNGGVPELLSKGKLTLAGVFASVSGWFSNFLAHPHLPVTAPVIDPPEQEPDIDKDGLKWEKLGFVVIDIDGAGGTATYIDEGGIPRPITTFGN